MSAVVLMATMTFESPIKIIWRDNHKEIIPGHWNSTFSCIIMNLIFHIWKEFVNFRMQFNVFSNHRLSPYVSAHTSDLDTAHSMSSRLFHTAYNQLLVVHTCESVWVTGILKHWLTLYCTIPADIITRYEGLFFLLLEDFKYKTSFKSFLEPLLLVFWKRKITREFCNPCFHLYIMF